MAYFITDTGVDIWRTAWTSLAVGVAAHVAIGYNNVEFERYLILFSGFAPIAYCGSLITLSQYYQYEVLSIATKLSVGCICLNVGFFMSLAIYRLFFHRCRKFPGPRLAGLSSFYASYMSSGIDGKQYYEKLEELHTQYGDYVRTGL
jgi:hypothetical protein